MGRVVGCVGVALAVLLGAGLFLTWVAEGRVLQNRAQCAAHLRVLGQFAAHPVPRPGAPDPAAVARDEVPPGTVVNPDLPPDRRLSWVVNALPVFDQTRPGVAALPGRIDRGRPWDAPPHRDPARVAVPNLLCPGNLPAVPAGEPAVTQYVGTAGLGADAATLGLGPPVPPAAGAFRYDRPTPFRAVADGLSNTAVFAETSAGLGPWLRGGPTTVRGLDAGPAAARPLGVGGQLGGNHPGGTNVGLLDGAVRFLTDRTDPAVVRGLLTIAGGPDELTAAVGE